MAKLPASFNTKKNDNRMGEFTPIPNGEYVAKIKETKKSATKATATLPVSKRVHTYSVIWEITQGEYKGRQIFVNLNLEHEKENVREMAEGEMLSIADACGVVDFDDLDDLKGIECTIKVGLKKGDANYPDSNKIRSYASLKGAKKPSAANLPDDDDEEETPAPKPKRQVASFD
jgi:hypothetical protein